MNKADALMHAEDIAESLLDMVCQHCSCGNTLDSMALNANADAIRMLSKLGLVEIKSDAGRRVIATIVKGDVNEEDTATNRDNRTVSSLGMQVPDAAISSLAGPVPAVKIGKASGYKHNAKRKDNSFPIPGILG